MVVRDKLYTVDEFWELVRLPENQKRRLEWEDGILVDAGLLSRRTMRVGKRITKLLHNHILSNNLGFVPGASSIFYLKAHKKVLRPDVSFVSKSRYVSPEAMEFDFAPDLAVEVVSEDEDIHKKAREYLTAGTKIVWAAYAEERTVYVMTIGDRGAITSLPFTGDDILDGGDVLPGFKLAVRDIFPV